MGCGCSGLTPMLTPLTVLDTDRREARRARAFMCGLCVGGHTGDCPATGRPAAEMVNGGGCPLGRHPDAEGVVRWLDMDWYGPPAPLRWTYGLARRWLKLPRLTGPLPGCGCHRELRAIWNRYRALVSRRRAHT